MLDPDAEVVPTGPPLAEVLAAEYPDIVALGSAKAALVRTDKTASQACVARVLAKLAEGESSAAVFSGSTASGAPIPAHEHLCTEAALLKKDPRKSEYHSALGQLLADAAEATALHPHPQDGFASWVPHQLPLELVCVIRDAWDSAVSLKKEFIVQDSSREVAWASVAAMLAEAVDDSFDSSQPLLEADSAQEQRSGWNLEWTWRRRAQFNWGLETLRDAVLTRSTYHTDLKRRIDHLAEHMNTINHVADACRTACNAFCALGGDRQARAYDHLVAELLDAKQTEHSLIAEDVTTMAAEVALLDESSSRHKALYEAREASGGAAQELLEAKRDGYLKEVARLTATRDKEVEKHMAQKAALAKAREEEIERALRESQVFLTENSRQQEACDDEAAAQTAQCAEAVARLEALLEENAELRAQEEITYAEQRSTRKEAESTRLLLMKRLQDEAAGVLKELNRAATSLEAELVYTKSAVAPFCHVMTLTVTACQRDHLLDLYDRAEGPPECLARCLVPMFTYRARLCCSMVHCAEDIENVLGAAYTQRDFCKETDDPKGALIEAVVSELKTQKAAMLEEAMQTRLRMATDVKCWIKVGRRAEELWYVGFCG